MRYYNERPSVKMCLAGLCVCRFKRIVDEKIIFLLNCHNVFDEATRILNMNGEVNYLIHFVFRSKLLSGTKVLKNDSSIRKLGCQLDLVSKINNLEFLGEEKSKREHSLH